MATERTGSIHDLHSAPEPDNVTQSPSLSSGRSLTKRTSPLFSRAGSGFLQRSPPQLPSLGVPASPLGSSHLHPPPRLRTNSIGSGIAESKIEEDYETDYIEEDYDENDGDRNKRLHNNNNNNDNDYDDDEYINHRLGSDDRINNRGQAEWRRRSISAPARMDDDFKGTHGGTDSFLFDGDLGDHDDDDDDGGEGYGMDEQKDSRSLSFRRVPLHRLHADPNSKPGFSFSEGYEDDEEDDEDGPYLSGDEDGSELGRATSKAFGVSLPQWCTRGPSWNRIASFVVRRAPCFWCSGSSLELGATDRSILYRLNVLCSVFAVGQILAGLFLIIVMFAPGIVDRKDDVVNRNDSSNITPNLWNVNGAVFLLAMIGFFCLVSMIYTLGVIREVNLAGSLRYMWIMVWLLPLQIFVVISVVDYHRVTEVWVRHWWSVPTMAWFRAMTCGETANTLCIVPVLGGPDFRNEDEWCLANFNSTECTSIRDDAEARVLAFAYFFYNFNFVWGLVLMMLLVLAVNVLEGIVTKPVVQSSRESNVPAWLTLPTMGCFAMGLTLLYANSSVLSAQTEQSWVGALFLASGSLFLVAAILGWAISAVSILNSRDKQNKKIGVLLFIGIMTINAILVAAIFASSILLSTSLVDVPLSDNERGRLACLIDGSSSCTFCDMTDSDNVSNQLGDTKIRACPEWEESEVVRVLQTQFKQSGTVAALMLLYAMSALRFGWALRKHIARYEIDYI